ncbi:MAG: hypothetical protein PUE95_04405 [Lachnospiraceae bacterium]|nr:hypothetical protein [Lachnospiraceae bacterium]
MDYKGYVVSDIMTNPLKVDGKKVVSLKRENIGDDGVLVGILSVPKNEIEMCLKSSNIENYFLVYDLDIG